MTLSIDTLIWLCVILFVVHEFEEIAFIRPWLARHRDDPRIRSRPFYMVRHVSTSAIALMVGEEILLFSLFAFAAAAFRWYTLFAGLLVVYTLHLIGHLVEPLRYRMYLPSVVTSATTLPWYPYALYVLLGRHHADPLWTLVWTVGMAVVVLLNFRLIYRMARRVEAWLGRTFWHAGEAARSAVPADEVER